MSEEKGEGQRSCPGKMMEKKFGKLVANVGKNAKDLLGKSKDIAVQVGDQRSMADLLLSIPLKYKMISEK